jgi:hypothetical protein
MAIGGTVRGYGDTLINKRSSAGGTVARMLGGSPPSTGDIESIWSGIIGRSEYDPQGYKLDQTQANVERNMGVESRMGQELLGGQLQAQIRGLGPTVAGQQQRFGMAEAMRNAGTQAANARGVNRGMALRESLYAGQDAQAQANRDASLMRASEQLGAMGQYGQLASQQRAGDIQSREVSLGAEKANQQAEMQRQGYQNETANQNAARKQKGFGSIASAAGGIMGALSDVGAKEDVSPIEPSFARALKATLTDPWQRPQQPQPGQNAMTIGESQQAGDAARSAAYQRMMAESSAAGADDSSGGSGGFGGGGGGGFASIAGGALQNAGSGLMSDRKSKERIRELEGMLYGRPVREIDQQNPYRKDYLSEAERSVENGFDSKANLAPIHPYSFRYKPEFAALIAEQAAGMAPPSQQADAAGAAYADARVPRAGVMAQEVSKAPGARGVVSKTPVGLMLDTKRSLGFTMANQAGLDKRLAALEAVVGSRR